MFVCVWGVGGDVGGVCGFRGCWFEGARLWVWWFAVAFVVMCVCVCVHVCVCVGGERLQQSG